MTNREDRQDLPGPAGGTIRTDPAPGAQAGGDPLACAACGVIMPAGSQYCLGCGAKLGSSAAGDPPASPSAPAAPPAPAGPVPPPAAPASAAEPPQQWGQLPQGQEQPPAPPPPPTQAPARQAFRLPVTGPRLLSPGRPVSTGRALLETAALLVAASFAFSYVEVPNLVMFLVGVATYVWGIRRFPALSFSAIAALYGLSVADPLFWRFVAWPLVLASRGYAASTGEVGLRWMLFSAAGVSVAVLLFAYFNAAIRASLTATVNPDHAGIDPLRAGAAVVAGIALLVALPMVFQGGSSFELLPAAEASSDDQATTTTATTATTIDPVEQCRQELSNLIDTAEDDADEDGDGRIVMSEVFDRLQENIGSEDPRFQPLVRMYTNFHTNQDLYGTDRASAMLGDEFRSWCRTRP
jgi:hypothetical protein